MCQREERKKRQKGKKKEKEEEGLKTGEGERKYMTTKYRHHSSYVHFTLFTVKLSKKGRSTLPQKRKLLKSSQNQLKKAACLRETYDFLAV